jgi:vancomycin resistance protein VanJ
MCLVGCVSPPLRPRDPTPGVPHFTVQTYNIFFRTPGDRATLEAIGRAGADLIALEEVSFDWEPSIRERYAETYPYQLFHPEAGAGGYAVLSRFPLVDGGIREAPHHPGWHVLVGSPMGIIELLLVHLRAHFKGRSDPLEAYLEVGQDHLADIETFTAACNAEWPTLVVGDFNEEDGGSAVEYLEDQGYRDVLPLFHPAQPTYRHAHTPAGQFDAQIDHIMFEDAFEPLNAWVVEAGESDHFPVVAHFERAL